MSTQKAFQAILTKFRKYSFSEKHKGEQFERLMQGYLQTDPKYISLFTNVWLWSDFFGRRDFGGHDTGIDLVAKTVDGEFWAIQCKCYAESATIDKPTVDSFLSTSSRKFKDEEQKAVSFSHRLWISTTNHWGTNAEEAIQNQHPPVSRINLYDLQEAPVDWAKLEKGLVGEESRTAKKFIREHQTTAVLKTSEYFKTADRGKLIMACGTGKTFTALKIAERETKAKGLVLFLVPSIALLGQTLREWYAEANEPINAICICSDAGVSKKTTKNEDSDGSSVVDLALPASTNVPDIVKQFQHAQTSDKPGMTVVFSTYQSIDVIAKAQAQLLKSTTSTPGIFDLIICDEAHRTTGVTQAGEDSSAFVKVHDNEFIQAKKRLYMTATPRLFNDDSKSRAAQYDALLCSMDDVTLYGEEIYRIGFGEAVAKGLLTDYKVLILTMSENDVPAVIQKIIANPNNEINTDDASKLVGCINALSKRILGDAGILKDSDPEPMRRAVAFCQNIKVSKKIATAFNDTRAAYIESMPDGITSNLVSVTADHVDGAMSAPNRDEKLAWLKADTDDKECRILTNVRCLSEGVDVPSLDAVLFMTARNSQVDVVQSVGRVMRLSPGKKYGYIIIPVVIPAQASAEKALDDNERYRVVWTVLNALRAHDDRFNAIVNKIELNKHKPDQILIGQIDNTGAGEGQSRDSGSSAAATNMANQMSIQFEQLQSVVFARMVEKVGDRRYWEQWAKDVAQIAERYMERINRLIRDEKAHSKAFAKFLSGLQQNINPSITQGEAVEMLSQHVITKPVFEALFQGYSFVKNNPISVSMQTMLDLLEDQSLDNDNETLQRFYESVRSRASGIDNAAGKQRIIVELYDKFFKSAFPKMVEKLGIVYTPVEVVDFIIHSVNDLLKKKFGRSLSDENIHVLDPFTGTGTFMTRLLQSGLIESKDLERKYTQELHANEIVLLAYYIAAVNIENTYHDLLDATSYQAFEGICLTDTFQLGEKGKSDELFSDAFPQNSARVEAQKKAPLRVIIGNPPYSVGQSSANDNAQNQSYPGLDNRISKTYAAKSNATLQNSLYDSYIKAFRWSSDRLDPEHGGIIAFVSNGAWIDGNATSGFRKCLEQEFSSIYVFNLRGNQRTSGELSRKEGGKIFGSGSRTPISITFLVKNPALTNTEATIYYHDIGDYLSREDKLQIVSDFKSMSSAKMVWQTLSPNEHGDWLNQRNDVFGTFIPLGDKDNKQANAFFVPFYSNGVKSNRDAWAYNSSKPFLKANVTKSIKYFNEQVDLFSQKKKLDASLTIEDFIEFDSSKLSWDYAQKVDLAKHRKYEFAQQSIITSIYRPFFKQNLYFNRDLLNRVYQMPKLFPNLSLENRIICVSGIGVTKDFSTIITDTIPDLELIGKSQCFPLYYYEERNNDAPSLFDKPGETKFVRRDGISNFILEQAKKSYGPRVTKEDIFYYVYGFLHNPGYRTQFASDLKKMLPRLFLVEESKDFWAFSKAGRELADLHIDYESVPPASNVIVNGADNGYFRVEKMRYPSKDNKSVIHYNSKITIENIPSEAYEYVVNGKSAIEWIMERYQITVHKDSGIRNDPNDWATEVGNPRYILDLLLSVINVSVQTVAIVNGLPALKIGD
ncbi:DEAD/DEAH box helicase family protein [Larkinella knui]|uniref:Helicase n=1 Tax=Larkinella knui TaxID=2025310 RepID=A0A3P1CZ59_9BACT|nr:type ISP restriction/modification enzyme [Larkinella knui]RRB18164.1 helicase [Larkinella knui]